VHRVGSRGIQLKKFQVQAKMNARSYSQNTIKILFGASGNQCAYPGCTNSVIAPGTPFSDAAVLAQICHIYGASDNGPRGKPGLTTAERNSPDNLILLCGHHHPLVDKQWQTYPADLLKAWKKTHEAKFQHGTAEAFKLQESMQQLAFQKSASDQQIAAEIDAIRQRRFINGFPIRQKAAELAERIARATSIVRYAPGSHFSPHTHGGGEEFFVLEGIFGDEQGEYPPAHTPQSADLAPHSWLRAGRRPLRQALAVRSHRPNADRDRD
jgi:hypothetical protein